MGSQHLDPLIERTVTLPSERSTGLVFACVCVIGAVLFRSHAALALVLLGLAAVFAGFAILWPDALKSLNEAWFALALMLNKIMTPVIMFVLFVITIVPFGLVMQFSRDPLQRHRARHRASYWIAREQSEHPSSMRNQF